MSKLHEKVSRLVHKIFEDPWRDSDDATNLAIAAVLRAMMEPSERMVDAGASRIPTNGTARPSEYWAREVWQTMLKQFAKENGIEL